MDFAIHSGQFPHGSSTLSALIRGSTLATRIAMVPPDPCPNMPIRYQIHIAAGRKIVQNHLDIINRIYERFRKFTDEPLLHRTIVIAMAIHCRDKTYRCKSIFRHKTAEFVIPEAVGLGWVAVEIQNYGWLCYVFRLNHVQINRIVLAPSHLNQLQSEIGILGGVGH